MISGSCLEIVTFVAHMTPGGNIGTEERLSGMAGPHNWLNS